MTEVRVLRNPLSMILLFQINKIKTTSLKINGTELHESESEGYCSKFSYSVLGYVSTATVGENSWML